MKKSKEILLIVLAHLGVYLLMTLIWVLSFRTPLLAFQDILFYRGLMLIVIFGVIGALLMVLLRKTLLRSLTVRDIILQFFIFCCVNTVLFTHLPVTTERSVSVFMLSYLTAHQDESFTEQEIEDIFVKYYVHENKAMAKRLHEQEATGTIARNEDGTYQITPRGKTLAWLFKEMAVWFGTDDTNLMPGEFQKSE